MKTRLTGLALAGVMAVGMVTAAKAQSLPYVLGSIPYEQQLPGMSQYPGREMAPPYLPPNGNPGTFPTCPPSGGGYPPYCPPRFPSGGCYPSGGCFPGGGFPGGGCYPGGGGRGGYGLLMGGRQGGYDGHQGGGHGGRR
jgi:hypothetical protein